MCVCVCVCVCVLVCVYVLCVCTKYKTYVLMFKLNRNISFVRLIMTGSLLNI